MTFTPTPLASAVALLLSGSLLCAQAQDAPAPSPTQADVQQVEVHGIRQAYASSIGNKKGSDSIVEVITAEDIGKLPAKNVADTVQRLPGVNISSNSGGDGAFADANRVSIRGTAPSLTQTLVNGHSVGSADWFISNQGVNGGASGRSVSYDLLPAEIVGKVVVHKSATADLVEGGTSGAVDIETRSPLSLTNALTVDGTLQTVYGTTSRRWDPQASGLVGWKNEAKTAGVILQLFSERRHDRRDGQEFLGYGQFADGALAKDGTDLGGKYYANNLNATLLEMSMQRTGGMVDVEFKPTPSLRVDVNGFHSKLTATNQDSSLETEQTSLIDMGLMPDTAVVRNGVLQSATWLPSSMPDYASTGAYVADYDKYYRPGESAKVDYLDASFEWNATDAMRVTGKLGRTKAIGGTPNEYAYVTNVGNAGLAFQMNGLGKPSDVSFPGYPNTGNFNDPHLFLAYAGLNKVRSTDSETYGQADGDWDLNQGLLESVKFGARVTAHTRDVLDYYNEVCQVNVPDDTYTACHGIANWNGQVENRYGLGLGGGPGFLSNIWQLSPNDIAAYVNAPGNLPATALPYSWQSSFTVKERTAAAYAMANLAGDHWKGNVGLRLVNTHQVADYNQGVGDTGAPPGVTVYPDPHNGDYYQVETVKDYTDLLPSANVRLDLQKNLVGRLSASRTMTRADYTDLAGAVSLNGQNGTGSGGNPLLKPVRSTNFDAAVEWYFAPQALLQVGLFYMDLTSYIGYGQHSVFAPNLQHNPPIPTPTFEYTVSSPVNDKGTNKGVELGWQQPVAAGFGFDVNYSYCLGRDSNGQPLAGSSKHTYNLEGYFENDAFSTRLTYNYRSDFLTGIVSAYPQYVQGSGDWSASVNVKLTKQLSLSVDGKNLAGTLARQYVQIAGVPAVPSAIYNNGRQFYLGLKYSM
jgi:iron complex outermembrane receptor protein